MSFTTLVDAATLAAHLDDPNWLIVDVRHQLADPAYGERSYAEAHIPGAVFLHCDRDLSGQKTGMNGRHPLPDPEKFARRMGEIGLGAQTQVIVYDDAQGMIAGRLWWLLRWLGHDQVAVLDGGLPAWKAANGVLTPAVLPTRPVNFVARICDRCVDTNYIQAFLATSRLHLVDARSPDRYRGENETLDPVGGHIPGAVNRFFQHNLQADGRFKPAAELRAEWLGVLAGALPEQVVHQCGSGISACHNLLAMEIAGLPGSRLYGGSWSEWCANPERPIA
ncbi:MAG: sulfurtransferase [Betaproteobacteria bacterium HGW-Betaproteobacteria-10]|nr:MAG: sulfurtransferase [Betaproteobacteria bacterium HGW-Betaproteobacteria-10]